ncbi:MAG TPA: hypothetical protein VK212_05900 [Lentimicrobium sp.]|nr:hypothetical protein [Lentimicrobium sp.]
MAREKNVATATSTVSEEYRESQPNRFEDHQSILSAGSVRRKDREALKIIERNKLYITGAGIILAAGTIWWLIKRK